jgi:hypothetical protein
MEEFMMSSTQLRSDEPHHFISWVEAYDPTYWQRRAAVARIKARTSTDSDAAVLLREAADYDRLARCAADVLGAEGAT